MQQPVLSDFELLLFRSGNEVGAAVLLVLAWISASDGEVSDSEAERLAKIAGTSHFHGHAGMLARLARERDLGALQLACEIIKTHFLAEKVRQFLGQAIAVAFADRSLKETENHIIRFLANLLGMDEHQLDDHFLEFTGQTMPRPGDSGSADHWAQGNGAKLGQNHFATMERIPSEVRDCADAELSSAASTKTHDRLYDTLLAIGLLRGRLGLGQTSHWNVDFAADFPGDSSAPRSLYDEFKEKISGD